MFLEQPRPHFLTSSRPPAINLVKKTPPQYSEDIVRSAIYHKVQIKIKTAIKLNLKHVPLKNGNLRKTKKLKRVFIYV